MRIALVIAFCNLAGAFGGAIAYGIGHVNGGGGLEGFRWLFIIEGIITILSVLPTLLILPDYPSRDKWLSDADKKFAEDRLKERGGGYNREHATRNEIIQTFFAPRMLAHYFAYVRTSQYAHCISPASHGSPSGPVEFIPTSYIRDSGIWIYPKATS